MRKILCSLMIGALLLAGGGALITAKTSMRAAFAEENVAAFTDTITEGQETEETGDGTTDPGNPDQGGEETPDPEQPEQPVVQAKIATAATMIENKDKLYATYTKVALPNVGSKVIPAFVDSYNARIFYGDDTIDGIEVEYTSTDSANLGSQLAITLRDTAGKTFYDGGAVGYVLYVKGQQVYVIRRNAATNPWGEANACISMTLKNSIFDGETHIIRFVALDSADGQSCTLSLQIDDQKADDYTETVAPLPKTNGQVSFTSNGTKHAYSLGEIVEAGDYDVNYISAETMMTAANKDKLIAGYDAPNTKLSVADGYILSHQADGAFVYQDAEIDAVDFNFQYVSNSKAVNDICFALRAQGGGAMWGAKGYYAYVNGTALQIYKVSNLSSWSANMMASGTVANIFDGTDHRVQFYAVTDSNGYVQVGFSVDGAAVISAMDTENVLPIGTLDGGNVTVFKINNVNGDIRYKISEPDESKHTYEEVIVTQATCTQAGSKHNVCEVCGKEQADSTEEIAALGHDYVDTVVPPTCTEDGCTTHICSRCDDAQDPTDTVPATGHSWGEGVVTAPTCTEGGYTEYACTVCEETKRENETDPAGHSWGEGVVTAPTCTEKGYTTYECQNCDATKTDNETQATGHSYTDTVIAPTCTEKGYTKHTCENCDHTYNDTEVAATGHEFEETERVEPTGDTDGYVDYKCKHCNETKRETLEKTGIAAKKEGCKGSLAASGTALALAALAGAGLLLGKKKREND